MKIEIWILVLLLFAGCTGEDDPGNAAGHGAGLIDVNVDLSFTVSESDAPVTRSVAFTAEGEELGVKGADSTAIATAVAASDTASLLPSDTSVVQTKAASAADNTISTLWVGQYDAAGNLLIAHYVTGIMDNQASFQLKESPSCYLRFVANGGDPGKPATLNAFKTHQIAYTADPTSCPMYGELNGQSVSVTYQPDVTLTRMLSHIRLSYNVVSGSDFAFTPSYVKLLSVPDHMQCVEPDGPLTGITYTSFSVETNAGSGTHDWYIPENKSGTIASGQNGYATTAREKTGSVSSVPNASYLEIGGNAEVNGVTYTNVIYRFYLGSSGNANDYNVKRNTTYNVTLALSGIDWSDPRVSATVPDLVAPAEMEAAIHSTTTMDAVTRPGAAWTMQLPAWLSALLDGTTSVAAGGNISYTGSSSIEFKAATANPDETDRVQELTLTGGDEAKNVTVTQKASTLTAGDPATLKSKKDETGTLWFNGTSGLPLTITPPSWITLTSDAPATTIGDRQTVDYKTIEMNPNDAERLDNIVVKAGNITRTVAITQSPSIKITGSPITVNAEAATGLTSSFTAASGLEWVASVTSGSWITLTTQTGTTTGSQQNVTFGVAVNPSSSERKNDITVSADDAGAIPGTIAVTQRGATLAVSDAKTVNATASTGNTSTFSATKGLSWNVGVASSGSWLTLTGTTSGTNNTTGYNQNITYSAVVNPNASTRNGTITVKAGNAVGGTDAGLTKTITVTQSASALTAGDPYTLAATKDATGTLKFTGTAGLGVTITPPNTISLTGTAPSTTNGSQQSVGYKAIAANPNSSERAMGNITVKAGNITKTVAIRQSASSLTATINPTGELAETAGASGTYTINGTRGLSYTITGFPAWLTASNGTASTAGGETSGGSQYLTYRTASINPNGSARSANIRVTAGNMSANVSIKQAASTFDRANPTGKIATTANSKVTGSVTATPGLEWTISPSTNNGITASPTSGSGNATITFTGAANDEDERTGIFTLSATGANPARTLTFSVTQATGAAYAGSVQVAKQQDATNKTYSEAVKICNKYTEGGKTGWRLPTVAEWQIIYQERTRLESEVAGFPPFTTNPAYMVYWTSTVEPRYPPYYFNNYYGTSGTGLSEKSGLSVRCVRDK